MPYPKRYVGNYHNLANWLVTQGHAVYPMEMVCQPVVHKRNYFVDVVTFKDAKLWAWEYKSQGDSVKRAILQVENYVKSFDFVSVVAEDLRDFDSMVRKRGLYVKTILQRLGVGVYFMNDDGKFDVLYKPSQQTPNAQLHDELVRRFRRYVFHEEPKKRENGEDSHQKTIQEWIKSVCLD